MTGETEEDIVRSAVEHDIKEHGKIKKGYGRDERKTQKIHLYYILLRYHKLIIDAAKQSTRISCLKIMREQQLMVHTKTVN